MRRLVAQLDTWRLVLLCGLLAGLARFPGMVWPIRPDEAGYTLVARAWHPEPDSLYGTYWVDRPPPLILVYKVSDWLGGPLFIRAVAALACVVLVVAAARTAYLLAGDRAARWTALATAAMTANTMIDGVAAKGEILGIPLVVGSFCLSLEALRVLDQHRWRAAAFAAGAGFLGMAALGLKQNMASGLAFGGVLLLTSAVLQRITWADFVRLGGAALAGAAVPLGVTIGWCLAEGVHLHALWYAVYGFRGDAVAVIARGSGDAPSLRAGILALAAVGTGIAILLGWFLLHLRHAWQVHPAATAAIVAVISVDTTGLVLGGSYWRPYLFCMIPSAVLATALTADVQARPGPGTRRIIRLSIVSSLVSLVVWVASEFTVTEPPTEFYTGRAIGEVSEPGDTIVVYGGRADIVMASGLPSPYEHLWSLTARTRDPGFDELTAVLRSDRAPTWFVGWVNLDYWTGTADPGLQAALEDRYVPFGEVCDHHPLWLLRGVSRDHPAPKCDQHWGLGELP